MTSAKLTFPEFEVQGRWFLPETSDYSVVGILKFSPYYLPELKLIVRLPLALRGAPSPENIGSKMPSSKNRRCRPSVYK